MSAAEAAFAFGFTAALLLLAAAAFLKRDKRMRVSPGDRVRDKISGAAGIVTCRSEWQYGCVRLTIQPEEQKDGKPAEAFVIDEAQAEVVKAQALPDTREAEKPRPHGDRPAAARPAEPSRP